LHAHECAGLLLLDLDLTVVVKVNKHEHMSGFGGGVCRDAMQPKRKPTQPSTFTRQLSDKTMVAIYSLYPWSLADQAGMRISTTYRKECPGLLVEGHESPHKHEHEMELPCYVW